MIPQISSSAYQVIQYISYPSFTYKIVGKQIAGNIDGIQAIVQTIYHILNTERYAYEIYGFNYGVEFDKYKGKSFEYLETTIENTLKGALLQDDRIEDIIITKIEKSDINSACIVFDVITNLGRLEMNNNIQL